MERKQKTQVGMAPTVEVDMRELADELHLEIDFVDVVPDDEKPTVKPPASSAHIPKYTWEPYVTPDSKGGWVLAITFEAEAEYTQFGLTNKWIVPCQAGLRVEIHHFMDSTFLRSDLVRSQLAVDRGCVWVKMDGATSPVSLGRMTDKLVEDIYACFYAADLARSKKLSSK